MNNVTLEMLEEGTKATVLNINNKGSIRRRLQDVGLVVGNKVRCLHISPCGNPKAFEIMGAVIAIRNEDAKQIIVDINEEGDVNVVE